METSIKDENSSLTKSDDAGLGDAQEVDLNASTTSEEEAAAIERHKEELRKEIKEV